MTKENLPVPASPQPAGEKQVSPYATDGYVIAEANEGNLSIVELPPEQRELVQWEPPDPVKVLIRSGVTGVLVNAGGLAAYDSHPVITLAGTVVSGFLVVGMVSYPSLILKRLVRQQRATKRLLQSEATLHLPYHQLGVDVSDEVLGREVVFKAEGDEIVSLPAGELIASAGEHAPGLQFSNEVKGRVGGAVSPGGLVRQAMSLVGAEGREAFLQDAQPNLKAMHKAAGRLKSPGLTPRTPDSMRPALEKPATDLLLGTLGVLGVLRAHAGPRIAQRVQDFYTGEEDTYPKILNNAVTLKHPTFNTVPWQTLMDWHNQLPPQA